MLGKILDKLTITNIPIGISFIIYGINRIKSNEIYEYPKDLIEEKKIKSITRHNRFFYDSVVIIWNCCPKKTVYRSPNLITLCESGPSKFKV